MVHADNDDRLIYGMRAEGNFGPIEAGVAAQYHPVTNLQFLNDFDLKMFISQTDPFSLVLEEVEAASYLDLEAASLLEVVLECSAVLEVAF